MLAVAYVLRLDDLRREVDALNLAAAVAGTGQHVDWQVVKAEFDADLEAPMGAVRDQPNTSRAIKVRALGME